MEDYALHIKIPEFNLMDNPDILEHSKQVLMIRGAEAVFSEIYKAGHPVIVSTHIETWRGDIYGEPVIHLQLHYQLTAVQTHEYHVKIPVFTFVNHEGKLEWKCAFCGTINPIEAKLCGELHHGAAGCGHAREKVRQEM